MEKAATGGSFEIGPVLIHLTGKRRRPTAAGGARDRAKAHGRAAGDRPEGIGAAQALRDVESGKFGRCILVLVPLMQAAATALVGGSESRRRNRR
jgi:hypothetical protein